MEGGGPSSGHEEEDRDGRPDGRGDRRAHAPIAART